jgi:hypothetical protein
MSGKRKESHGVRSDECRLLLDYDLFLWPKIL